MFVKELEITLENGMKISGELDLPERQVNGKRLFYFMVPVHLIGTLQLNPWEV